MSDIKNKGWSVTMAGLGINLALGILYTWSIFKMEIEESIIAGDGRFSWGLSSVNDPYAVCCLVFAFSMIIAGRMQDKFSPRLTTLIGGVLTGLGLVVISQSASLWVWILGFGLLTGMGLGFGYASATPPAIKWFPPKKTGMIAGIVVAGFGLASVYIAPLADFFITQFGLNPTMMIFGVAFFIIVSVLSLFLVDPPEGYVHENTQPGAPEIKTSPVAACEIPPMQMLKTKLFYRLWFMYFIGAGAGLFIIGGVADLAKQSLGDMAWLAVAFLAVGNAGGRVIGGILSDKIGRMQSLAIMMTFQSLIIFSLVFISQSSQILIALAATFIGFNYGTNLSLFPSLTKDHFGLKDFGSNYGIVFTAWGVGGFIFPRLAQMVVAHTGTLSSAYMVTAVLLLASAAIAVYGIFMPDKEKELVPAELRVTKEILEPEF